MILKLMWDWKPVSTQNLHTLCQNFLCSVVAEGHVFISSNIHAIVYFLRTIVDSGLKSVAHKAFLKTATYSTCKVVDSFASQDPIYSVFSPLFIFLLSQS